MLAENLATTLRHSMDSGLVAQCNTVMMRNKCPQACNPYVRMYIIHVDAGLVNVGILITIVWH